jgi:hypothetical protein
VFQAVGAGTWPGAPGAPTSVIATAGDASASVAFTAPASAGGSPITSYTVTSSPGSVTASGASSPITVTGLTNGTAYTFTVTATNAQGTGPASAASNSVTPATINYIEDVFSTYLYAGNSSTQTITNGINLSSNGGLVWIKARNGSGPTRNHRLWTTNLTGSKVLQSDSTAALYDYGSPQVTFNSNGFGLSSDAGINATSSNYASWTFRKQSKFFDIVTYTGNGVAGREIPHNLGSTPGCVIIKCLNAETNWSTWHNGLAADQVSFLNTTDQSFAEGDFYATAPTSTVFTVASFGRVNGSGNTYVAYLFADDAGGFGTSGTDNVISCGSFTADGNNTITLGYEPQWILTKRTSSSGNNWEIYDTMRGMSLAGSQVLNANTSGAEGASGTVYPTATGFYISNYGSGTIIYIAIRRGLMAAPTVGTSVFSTQTYAGNNADIRLLTTNTVVDTNFITATDSFGAYRCWSPRLTGGFLETNDDSNPYYDLYSWTSFQSNVGVILPTPYTYSNSSSLNYVTYSFSRAAKFHDVVYYAGNGAIRTINHNLTVAPEMLIVKKRTSTGPWNTYVSSLGPTIALYLNTTGGVDVTARWNSTAPTSTVFSVNSNADVNESGQNFIAYLFATCPGVSKVGSYTGTGALQTINCGFTTGARFIMIKRTDATGDWYFYDSSRGITSGNDPYMFMNATNINVTNTNYVDTTGVGFQVTAAAPAALNDSGGNYIFLAIA